MTLTLTISSITRILNSNLRSWQRRSACASTSTSTSTSSIKRLDFVILWYAFWYSIKGWVNNAIILVLYIIYIIIFECYPLASVYVVFYKIIELLKYEVFYATKSPTHRSLSLSPKGHLRNRRYRPAIPNGCYSESPLGLVGDKPSARVK